MSTPTLRTAGLALVVATLFTFTALTSAFAVIKHKKKFAGAERVTAVSGYPGGYKILRPNTSAYALYMIQWWERADTPQQVKISAHDINVFTNKWGAAKLGVGANGNPKFVSSLGGSFSIYKVQACTTNKGKTYKNKLKGLRIWVRENRDNKKATLVDQPSPQAATHKSCKKWHKAVACGAGELAVGVRLHYIQTSFSGIALICRKVVPM